MNVGPHPLKQDLRRQARARAKVRLERGAQWTTRQTEAMVRGLLERNPPLFDSWKGRGVALYRPMQGEPDCDVLASILRALGAVIAYPRIVGTLQLQMEFRVADPTNPAHWESSELGIRSPRGDLPELSGALLEMICLPGLAFDARGQRLGRGRGHYDRYLAHHAQQACRVALCFEEDLLEELPVEDWDARVQVLATERRVVECDGH